MDRFTETYIEMVINNKQIQDLCKYNKGDWFIGTFAFYHSEKPKPKVFCKSGLGSFDPREHSWLPTLDDLFGMLDIESFAYIFGDLDNWAGYCFDRGKLQCEDLKEEVLEYVMNLNYCKGWNPDNKQWEEI